MEPNDDVELVLAPRVTDLGDGFTVRRALPAAARRAVGPFVFFDEMGPADLPAGGGLDVRPHPHIGLATLTWLFDGEILHRDSLGTVQSIRPGEVNWMTAGRGIAHSERTPPELRGAPSRLHGIQVWVALPADRQEAEPAFAHFRADELPVLEDGRGNRICLIAGALMGAQSPVPVMSDLFYADVTLMRDATFVVPAEHDERALYVVDGTVDVGTGEGVQATAGRMLVLPAGREVLLTAASDTLRLMLLGGAPLDGHRHVWWNFVSTSKERIEQAKEDWRAGRFPPVPDETESIPLPGDRPEHRAGSGDEGDGDTSVGDGQAVKYP